MDGRLNRIPLLVTKFHALAAVLLIIFAWLTVDSLHQKSATFDEPNHLARGLYPLLHHDFLLNQDHPPLANIFQAIPVLARFDPVVPATDAGSYPFFSYSQTVLWKLENDGPGMINTARYATVAIAILLGVTLYVWSYQLNGSAGAFVSLALFCFSPMILAHSRLVTTDIPHALGITLILFSLWRFQTHPSFARLTVCGVCLGVAISMKHTALIMIPILFIYFLVIHRGRLRRPPGNRIHPAMDRLDKRPMWIWLLVVGIALIILWGSYGFTVGYSEQAGFYYPAPDYIKGVMHRLATLNAGRQFYLNGEISSTGWWYYFPVAFAYKTPLPLLLMLLLFSAAWLLRRIDAGDGMPPILMILGGYLAAIAISRMNLGLRYLLPVYPFICLCIPRLFQSKKAGAVVILLLLWNVTATILAHPNYLSYFNAMIPPERKHAYLVDSNLDWGQDLPALAEYQRDHGLTTIRLGYFGTADPAAYGVRAEWLPSFLQTYPPSSNLLARGKPQPVAVSATLLQGVYTRPRDFYEPLRDLEPIEILNGSILIYDLSEEER